MSISSKMTGVAPGQPAQIQSSNTVKSGRVMAQANAGSFVSNFDRAAARVRNLYEEAKKVNP